MIPSLGNIFDHCLKDNEVITKSKKDLESWLKKKQINLSHQATSKAELTNTSSCQWPLMTNYDN